MQTTLIAEKQALRTGFPSGSRGALVIGGAHGSLGVVRSLGRQGIPAWILTNDHLITKFSRYTKRTILWPGPNEPDSADYLLNLAANYRLEGWVLFPGGDAEAQLISQNHDHLSRAYRVTTAPWDVVQFATDKRLTYDRAAELGLDHPWSYYPEGLEDVAALKCRYPVILKPTVRQYVNAFTAAKAWRIDSRQELMARYAQALALVGKDAIVLQEMVPGNGQSQFSYAAVWDENGPVASLIAQRARQYPINFGYTSTFVHSIEHPEIEAAACRFLRSIHYTGMVEIEFKYDQRDRRYKILDVNARTWTWHALGRLAGVDFPHIMYRVAMGEEVPGIRGHAGAAWMHFSRDLVAAIQEICIGRLKPSDYLKSLRMPTEFAAFAKDDPLPALVDLPIMLRRLLKRVARADRPVEPRVSSALSSPNASARRR